MNPEGGRQRDLEARVCSRSVAEGADGAMDVPHSEGGSRRQEGRYRGERE